MTERGVFWVVSVVLCVTFWWLVIESVIRLAQRMGVL